MWASPLPPTRSGVADYAAEILPFLAAETAVTLVSPPGWQLSGDAAWAAGLPRIEAEEPAPAGAISLLHLGNNPYHLWVATRLRRFGGVLVLHDTVVHHLLVEEAASDGAWDRFGEELGSAEGEAGRALAAARRWGFHGRLDPFLLPALRVYLRRADAVLVHSRDAAARVRRACPGMPVEQVPLAVAAMPGPERSEARGGLGIGDGELLLVHLGFLTPAKGLETILRAMLALVELGVRARLLVVGEGREMGDVEDTVRRVGLTGAVRLLGWVGPGDLARILVAADLGLVPRFPTAGETSAAALRFLASGTPVVVSGYRQFLELPAAAAYRVTPGRAGATDLVRVVVGLVRDPERLAATRVAARRTWEEGGHAPATAARRLAAAVKTVSGPRSRRPDVPRRRPA